MQSPELFNRRNAVDQPFDMTMIAATSTPPARATRLNLLCSCSARGRRWVAPTYTRAPAESASRAPSAGRSIALISG